MIQSPEFCAEATNSDAQPLRRANRRQPPRSVQFLSPIPAASCRSRRRWAQIHDAPLEHLRCNTCSACGRGHATDSHLESPRPWFSRSLRLPRSVVRLWTRGLHCNRQHRILYLGPGSWFFEGQDLRIAIYTVRMVRLPLQRWKAYDGPAIGRRRGRCDLR